MNSIPLIKGNTPQEINTSIIALKKALDNLQATNSEDLQKHIDEINAQIETINQQITDLQPIDSITSGNMHAVTSNAVANSNAMPVDTVTSGNMHSVTSNAVAEEVNKLVPTSTLTNVDLNTVTTFGIYRCNYNISNPDVLYHYPIANYGVLIVVEADGNRGQIFMPDIQNSIYKRYMSGDTWTSWVRFITSENVTNSVTNADMNPVTSNAVYQALLFQPILYIRDTRDDNFSPSHYMDNYRYRITAEFKSQTVIGDPFSTNQGFCILITITPWGDVSGGYPIQIAIDTQYGYGLKRRIANASLGWGSWSSL